VSISLQDRSREAQIAAPQLTMPVPQQTELHHSAEARFQNGNRLYKTVILGQGGVGKSGTFLLEVTILYAQRPPLFGIYGVQNRAKE
jgi:hypothetical protein